MPGKHRSSRQKKASSEPKAASRRRGKGKVGSDPAADQEVGGKLDFGIPAPAAKPMVGGREKGPEPGTGPMRSGDSAVRTDGVGHPPGTPGTGSGGDLDPDFVGLDGMGGVAATPPSDSVQGPDVTEGGSEPFASGPPAQGENEGTPGHHGAPSEVVRGSTIDRSR